MIFTISIMTNNRKQSFHNDNQQGYYNKQNDFCQNDTFKNIAAFKQQISQ